MTYLGHGQVIFPFVGERNCCALQYTAGGTLYTLEGAYPESSESS